MYGLLETEILVPEPWENPDGPNSRFQAVSDPPAIHEITAEFKVIFDEDNCEGVKQVGGAVQVTANCNGV